MFDVNIDVNGDLGSYCTTCLIRMLMNELGYEPKIMKAPLFRKFIKSCNLYKDRVMTEAFEKVFAVGYSEVDCAGILEAFDKEYPGKRKVPSEEELAAIEQAKAEAEERARLKRENKKKKKGKGKGKGKGGKKTGGGNSKKLLGAGPKSKKTKK